MRADTSTVKKALTAAIFEAFEKMFYIFLEPAPENGFVYEIEASVQFEGAFGGQMKMFFSRKLAVAMVVNLLNRQSDGVANEDLEDCAREAVNVICGSFLTKLENRRAFRLSVPECRCGTVNIHRNRVEDHEYWLDFDADGERLGVLVDLFEK
jgi:hypothetical protein